MCRNALILVALVVMAASVAGQPAPRDDDYHRLVQTWREVYDQQLRLKPDAAESLIPLLHSLQAKYPQDQWLTYVQVRLLAERGEWSHIQQLLLACGQQKQEWCSRWLLHTYWRQGRYSAFLRSPELSRYLLTSLRRMLLPLVLLAFAWWLSRRVGNRGIFWATAVAFIFNLLIAPYEMIAGILVSGAPFPISLREERLAEVVYSVLLYGTLLLGSLWLMRRLLFTATYSEAVSDRSRLLGFAAAGLILQGLLQALPLLSLRSDVYSPPSLAASINQPAFLKLLAELVLKDVALAVYFVMLYYGVARRSFGIVGAICVLALPAISSFAWKPLPDLLWTTAHFWALSVAPAVLLYESKPRWWVAAVPFWWYSLLQALRSLLEYAYWV